MPRFLFRFGFESPADARGNHSGSDGESSEAVWVQADDEAAALEKGRDYAEAFVAKLYREATAQTGPSWKAGDYAHWIERRPLDAFSGLQLEALNEI